MDRGFSLVELSIVLVILGLLTGGILAGQSLIRASQLRALSTEYSRYLTATQSFHDKYLSLPGDMPNATDFWNAAHTTAATCVTTPSTDQKTCNGNGDGIIKPSTGSNESYRYWQQLANAGLIEGTYDGITHGSTNFSSTLANSPVSKLDGGLWFIWDHGQLTSSAAYFDGMYRNFLTVGGMMANYSPSMALLKPEEMWNLDVKMDDGKPATGKVVILADAGMASCVNTTTTSNLAADYLLTGTAKGCSPIFRNAF